MSDRRLLTACLATSLGGILLSSYLHSPSSFYWIYSDIYSFWGRTWVSQGQIPYTTHDSFFEYPPLSGLVLYLARLVGGATSGFAGGTYQGYFDSFSGFSLVAAAVIAWSTFRTAKALGKRLNPLYFLLPSMIIYGVYNFDLFNALFIILTLQFFLEGRKDLSAFFLGLAIATKLVAIVLLPIFAMELAGADKRVRYVFSALLVALLTVVPIALTNPGFFQQFIDYFRGWGLEDAWYIWIFGDPFSNAAKIFGYAVMGILLLRVYTLKMPLVPRAFLALSAYLLGTYIYAPQFNVMMIPLVAVLALRDPSLFVWEIADALIILTWFSVPFTPTSGPTYPWTVPQAMSLIRSAALAFLGVSVASASGHSLLRWLQKVMPADVGPNETSGPATSGQGMSRGSEPPREL